MFQVEYKKRFSVAFCIIFCGCLDKPQHKIESRLHDNYRRIILHAIKLYNFNYGLMCCGECVKIDCQLFCLMFGVEGWWSCKKKIWMRSQKVFKLKKRSEKIIIELRGLVEILLKDNFLKLHVIWM